MPEKFTLGIECSIQKNDQKDNTVISRYSVGLPNVTLALLLPRSIMMLNNVWVSVPPISFLLIDDGYPSVSLNSSAIAFKVGFSVLATNSRMRASRAGESGNHGGSSTSSWGSRRWFVWHICPSKDMGSSLIHLLVHSRPTDPDGSATCAVIST
jgi:hypothetical protein